nr:hypothetical protein [Dyella sp. ASV24]
MTLGGMGDFEQAPMPRSSKSHTIQAFWQVRVIGAPHYFASNIASA